MAGRRAQSDRTGRELGAGGQRQVGDGTSGVNAHGTRAWRKEPMEAAERELGLLTGAATSEPGQVGVVLAMGWGGE